MTYQQIIEQKNLDVSIVEVKDLEYSYRIWAEVYHPKKINSISYLKSKKYCKLWELFYFDKKTFSPKNYKNQNEVIKLLELENIWNFQINEIIESKVSNIKSTKNIVWNKIVVISRLRPYLQQVWIIFDDLVYTTTELLPLKTNNWLLPEFLYIFLSTEEVQKILFYSQEWNEHPRFPTYILDNLPFPIPSNSFQQKIAELVQESYQQREESKKLYSQAEQVLLKEIWLEDYQPTENNISIKDSKEIDIFWRIDAEFFQPKYDEIIEKIKNYHWWWDHLDNLITISNKRIKKEENKSFQYIELADINASLGTVNSNNKILSQDLPSRAQMKIEKNDVLVSSIRGSAEKVAIVDHNKEDFVASTWFFILKPKFFNAETNLILMKSWIYRELLKRTARGMILEASNKNDFAKFILPKLDEKVQSKIAQLVQDSHKALENSKNLLEKAKKSVEIFIEQDETKAIEFLENKEF